MRYVIWTEDGHWLRRASNPTWRKEVRRRLVDDLNEATLWHAVGHAKNALIAAVDSGHLPKNTVAWIVPVELVAKDPWTKVTVKKGKIVTD